MRVLLQQNCRERTIIFVRHVESKWNYVFNGPKNPLVFVPRLIEVRAAAVNRL